MHTDVLIVGGGPAGLSAAIAARMKGLRVTLVDSRRPPIDKPCGEGLLPEAVAALTELGVPITEMPGFPFSGIRFSNRNSSVHARFGSVNAFGVRRTALHSALMERARAVGVSLVWGKHVAVRDSWRLEIAGRNIAFRWLVAADGLHSPIRRRAGLDPRVASRGRFAFRRHFQAQPWTDFVEVYWNGRHQMIVTPTGPDEICLALFTNDSRLRISSALRHFPEVERRLAGARATSIEAGAETKLSLARAVVRNNLALVGDASCSIDGIAGQGLSLAFQEALRLADALERDDLQIYSNAHREITRMPVMTTRLMLLMASTPWIQRKTLRLFAAKPALFSKMMAVHSDKASGDDFGLQELCGLGWQVLRA
jgi:2-polyprenyl-6-methoxyphenol hydroxylase-like FAD-dependent oxidoreductase